MATKGLPPLQRALEFLRKRFTGQELVGIDRAGNKYYRWSEKNDFGEAVEKRRVSVPGADVLYEPTRLPPEWRAWLTKTRAAAPTAEDMERAEQRAAALAARVAAIEAREAARRFRASALGREGPDLASFTSQLGAAGYGDTGGAKPGGSSGRDGGGGGGGGMGRQQAGPAPPPPPQQQQQQSGVGGGGSGAPFQPGVWEPRKN
ncbi:hypothetical protein Rsub_12192 [Raphidocelis subcapitata]|uniref:Uncharacterized protein n=1 Tax=Raphidocelis subcapitata TaxID=307507 RepID=A0A2V0PQ06_9CHLO|nr:hypothetical protein Rsub_12192 [Raphidocelis subcapitata]|eukprot:GBF99567.1 hypothetical protein Rsub_12192 [Raphidocelis subcapitata]